LERKILLKYLKI